ncbi:MAG: hypothetical protein LBP86_12190 [Azoarcus sp.]|jgi:hypothetical protein|nr:hypothetical protein [Azoarcus sp.]
MDTETEKLPLDLRLAAIITLLSSSALKGMTTGKTRALRQHLDDAAAQALAQGCHAHLASALQNASQCWQVMCECAVSSVAESCPWPHSTMLH